MNRSVLCGEPVGTRAFLFSRDVQETPFTMPPTTNRLSNERIVKLEEEISANAERTTNIHQDVTKLMSGLELLRDRAVTWKQLIIGVIIPFVVCAAGSILGSAALFSSSYSNRIPKDIEYGISTSPSLKKNFDAIDTQLAKLDSRLSGFSKTLGSLADPATLSASLKDATSVRKGLLAQTLPRIRNLLRVAKEMRVPLPPNTYKIMSIHLFGHYLSSNQPLRRDVWNTLNECASTRTFTDAALHPLSDAEIEQARSKKKYFEGDIDLSSRPEWKDVVFKDCRIAISKPERGLNLVNVRFVDCEFTSNVENVVSARLFESVLQTVGPELDIPHFKVLRPYFYQKDAAAEGVGN